MLRLNLFIFHNVWLSMIVLVTSHPTFVPSSSSTSSLSMTFLTPPMDIKGIPQYGTENIQLSSVLIHDQVRSDFEVPLPTRFLKWDEQAAHFALFRAFENAEKCDIEHYTSYEREVQGKENPYSESLALFDLRTSTIEDTVRLGIGLWRNELFSLETKKAVEKLAFNEVPTDFNDIDEHMYTRLADNELGFLEKVKKVLNDLMKLKEVKEKVGHLALMVNEHLKTIGCAYVIHECVPKNSDITVKLNMVHFVCNYGIGNELLPEFMNHFNPNEYAQKLNNKKPMTFEPNKIMENQASFLKLNTKNEASPPNDISDPPVTIQTHEPTDPYMNPEEIFFETYDPGTEEEEEEEEEENEENENPETTHPDSGWYMDEFVPEELETEAPYYIWDEETKEYHLTHSLAHLASFQEHPTPTEPVQTKEDAMEPKSVHVTEVDTTSLNTLVPNEVQNNTVVVPKNLESLTQEVEKKEEGIEEEPSQLYFQTSFESPYKGQENTIQEQQSNEGSKNKNEITQVAEPLPQALPPATEQAATKTVSSVPTTPTSERNEFDSEPHSGSLVHQENKKNKNASDSVTGGKIESHLNKESFTNFFNSHLDNSTESTTLKHSVPSLSSKPPPPHSFNNQFEGSKGQNQDSAQTFASVSNLSNRTLQGTNEVRQNTKMEMNVNPLLNHTYADSHQKNLQLSLVRSDLIRHRNTSQSYMKVKIYENQNEVRFVYIRCQAKK